MIDWLTIKGLIKSQVVEFSELSADHVRWVDEPGSGPLAGVSPIIYLRISSIVESDDGEERYQSNDDNDQEVMNVGQRTFTLSVRCESYTADISDPRSAANIIESVKVRIYRESSFQERLGVFAVVDSLGTKWFNFIADDERQVNAYVTEFSCATVSVDQDTSPNAGAWIGEVIGGSTPLNDVDGNPAATQIAFDVDAK